MRNSGIPQPKSSSLEVRASSLAPDRERLTSGFEHVCHDPIGDAITRHQYNVDVDEVIAACHFSGPIVHDFSTVDTQGFCQRSTSTSFIIDESLNPDAHMLDRHVRSLVLSSAL